MRQIPFNHRPPPNSITRINSYSFKLNYGAKMNEQLTLICSPFRHNNKNKSLSGWQYKYFIHEPRVFLLLLLDRLKSPLNPCTLHFTLHAYLICNNQLTRLLIFSVCKPICIKSIHICIIKKKERKCYSFILNDNTEHNNIWADVTIFQTWLSSSRSVLVARSSFVFYFIFFFWFK